MSRRIFSFPYGPVTVAAIGGLLLHSLVAPLAGGNLPLPVFITALAAAVWFGAYSATRNAPQANASSQSRESAENLATEIATANDISEPGQTDEHYAAHEALRASLREKDLLLKEIHHRVKNNLQVIVSLLGIQSSYIHDPRDLEVFTESQNRIHLMALVHEQLYQSKDLAHIDFRAYLGSLVDDVLASGRTCPASVSVSVDADEAYLDINAAIPCGLIVNELVTNCLKHAFAGRIAGRIDVGLRLTHDGEYVLTVADDGVGFPVGCDFRELPSLGMQLVASLAAQLQGTIEMRSKSGTEFRIVFPATEERSAERKTYGESEDSDSRGRSHSGARHQTAA